jgi:hypothetical protein
LGHDSAQRKVQVFLLRLLRSRSFQCFNRQASGDLSGTEARRLEGADPIYKDKELTFRVPAYSASQWGLTE